MANQPFTNLDFETVKTNLKNYLKAQDKFKDYDFAGSNMNVLLDVLAYNTFQNNFYTNMAISEMFLDSAQIKDSVVSHAKELNYLPRSRKSSMALLNIAFFPTNTPSSVVIPEKTKFTARCGSDTYSFWTHQSYSVKPDSDGNYEIENVEVFEGRYIEEFYQVDGTEQQKFLISNDTIDISSVEVFVKNSTGSTTETEYKYATDIFDVEKDDTVFFLQPHAGNRYEVIFGKDIFGKQPINGNVIRISYRITSGDVANGIATIDLENNIDGISSTETLVAPSSGGAEREGIESIRYFAPKSIQIQNRAVNENDYGVLLRNAFPEVRSVSVYGGERLEPPRFGKVVIAAYTNDDDYISNVDKQKYVDYLSDRTALTIEPIIVPARFMYLDVISDVYYNINNTNKTSGTIESLCRNGVISFSNTRLEDFKRNLNYSKLTTHIDQLDASIISNDTKVRGVIEIKPALNSNEYHILEFDNAIKADVTYTDAQINNYTPAIVTDLFTYNNKRVYIQDNGAGVLHIVQSINSDISIITRNIGTVNYETGKVSINSLTVQDYVGTAIRVFATFDKKDVTSPKDRILKIRSTDVSINVTGKRQ